jgi:glycosyltransferase involved in cell wall biosynthesis
MEKRFRIITPVYNAEDWVEKCINSVKSQKHEDFIQVIVDDCSTDRTIEKAREAIGEDPRFVLIEREKKTGTLHGHILAGDHDYSENDIFVHLDGDDWFSDDAVLSRLAVIYEDSNIWCTYGNYETTSGELSVNKPLEETLLNKMTQGLVGKKKLAVKVWHGTQAVMEVGSEKDKDHTFRLLLATNWPCSQVRSFRGQLWKGLVDEDFRSDDGSYLSVADVAVFVPILEMAGFDRIRYVPETQMIYNRETVLNDDKVNRVQVIDHAYQLAQREPKDKWKKLT